MKNLTNKLNNFTQNVKMTAAYVADAGKYINSGVKAGIVVGAAYALMSCTNPVAPIDPYNPVDVTATEIILNGDNPYNKFIGDDYIEAGAVAKNVLGDERTVSIEYANFDPDGDGVENAGEFVVEYTSDNISKERAVKNNVETGLEAVANAESNTVGKTVLEVANDEGFYLNRGTNDNVSDNIEGTYDVVGSWISSNGVGPIPYSYPTQISNQNGFSINFDIWPNSVVIGSEENKVSVGSFLDDNFDGENDRVNFANIDILPNGVLSIEEIAVPVKGSVYSEKWSKYTETWTPIVD